MSNQNAARTRPTTLRPTAVLRQFSLRTLFFVSFLIAVPYLFMAFVGSDFQTADAGGAPIFLMFGAAAVVISTTVGYSLGNRQGGFVGTLTAGGLWFATAALVLLSDEKTLSAFRIHGGAAFVVTSAICFWLYRHREPEESSTSPAAMDRLREAKKNSLAGRSAENENFPAAR